MRIILTGAAGRIGAEMISELSESHELVLLDRRMIPGKPGIRVDLARPGVISGWRRRLSSVRARWADVFEDADAVLHLAAVHTRATWRQLVDSNIYATGNVLRAAAHHRVPRFVFASSHWAIKAQEWEMAPDCYASDGPKIRSDQEPRPATLYGASKALAEILGRMFVDNVRIRSFVAVRIGSYSDVPPIAAERRPIWIGTADLRSLLRSALEAPLEGYHVVYGVSAQTISPFDLSPTCTLLSWSPRQTL